jgi:hypothetical protein
MLVSFPVGGIAGCAHGSAYELKDRSFKPHDKPVEHYPHSVFAKKYARGFE